MDATQPTGRAVQVLVARFLYAGTVAMVPLFRGLSDEVVSAICGAVQPMHALRGVCIME